MLRNFSKATLLILFLYTLSSFESNHVFKGDFISCKSEMDVNRKLLRFKYALRDLNNLPYSEEDFANEVMPIVKNKNEELAPNLVLTEYTISESNSEAILYWISNYPDEFKNFIEFLEMFNRSHF